MPVVVDLRQVREVLRRELRGGREIALPARLLAEPLEELEQLRLVLGLDRANDERAPVAELDSSGQGLGHAP